MKDLSWQNAERWLFLLIGVLPVLGQGSQSGHRRTCPDDPETSARNCLYPYNNLFTANDVDSLYTGVDAEVIRQMCSALMNSIICAHNLKEVCADTEHSDIEVVMDDIVSMYELCSQRNYLEVYSRNQNCYLRQSASSEECYNKFRAATEQTIMPQALAGEQTAVNQLCNHVETLITCIKTRVLVNCNEEAANMVDWLVKPSIRMSGHCRNETLYKSTTTTTPQTGLTATVKNHEQRWVPSSSTRHVLTWPLFLLVAANHVFIDLCHVTIT